MEKLANVASERAVLAGIARYGIDCYADVESIVDESTFTVEINKIIFKCLKHVLKNSNYIDFSSILSAANDLHLYEFLSEKDGLKHIKAIIETPIYIENVRDHALKIKRLEFGRDLQCSIRESLKELSGVTGNENISSILSIVESPLQKTYLKYLRGDNNRPQEIGNSIDEYINHLIENPCDQIGLSTGLPSFDKAIGGGLRRGCVDLVGARSGVGKSIFADCVALHCVSRNIPVLMLDTEMDKEDHYNRILANLSSVEINEIGTGKFSKDKVKLKKVIDAKNFLKKLPYYYISVAGKSFDEILNITRRWLIKDVGLENGRLRDCLIIYDYMKLMSAEQLAKDSLLEYQALGFQITQLHNFLVEYDCPCLSFVQLNRDGITKESTDVISGSDRLIWLCTSFSILKDKTEEEISVDGAKAGNKKLVILKSRHGPGMNNGYICLQMESEYARIKHLGTIREIQRRREGYASSVDKSDEQVEYNY